MHSCFDGFLNINIFADDLKKLYRRQTLHCLSWGWRQVYTTIRIDNQYFKGKSRINEFECLPIKYQKPDYETLLRENQDVDLDKYNFNRNNQLNLLTDLNFEMIVSEELIRNSRDQLLGDRGISFGLAIDRIHLLIDHDIPGNEASKKFNLLHKLNQKDYQKQLDLFSTIK